MNSKLCIINALSAVNLEIFLIHHLKLHCSQNPHHRILFTTSPILLHQWSRLFSAHHIPVTCLKFSRSKPPQWGVTLCTKNQALCYAQTNGTWDWLIIDQHARSSDILHLVPHRKAWFLTTTPLQTLYTRFHARRHDILNQDCNIVCADTSGLAGLHLSSPSRSHTAYHITYRKKDLVVENIQDCMIPFNFADYLLTNPVSAMILDRLNDATQCNICWEELDLGSWMMTQCCYHKFCCHCTTEMLKARYTPNCPICRQSLDKDNMVMIQGKQSDHPTRLNYRSTSSLNSYCESVQHILNNESIKRRTIICSNSETDFHLLQKVMIVKRLTGDSLTVERTLDDFQCGRIDALFFSPQYPCPDQLHLYFVDQIIQTNLSNDFQQSVLKSCHNFNKVCEISEHYQVPKPLHVIDITEESKTEI